MTPSVAITPELASLAENALKEGLAALRWVVAQRTEGPTAVEAVRRAATTLVTFANRILRPPSGPSPAPPRRPPPQETPADRALFASARAVADAIRSGIPNPAAAATGRQALSEVLRELRPDPAPAPDRHIPPSGELPITQRIAQGLITTNPIDRSAAPAPASNLSFSPSTLLSRAGAPPP